MLAKRIEYTDYNDEQRNEVFYFNLNKAELAMMSASKNGGLQEYLTKIVEQRDITQIAETFREIIHKAYGEKSPDGKRFIKSEELSTAFEQTEAYSELVMELLSSEEAAANFMRAIIPADISSKMDKNTNVTELPVAKPED